MRFLTLLIMVNAAALLSTITREPVNLNLLTVWLDSMDIAEDITVFMDIPFIVDITANDHQCRQGLLLLISRISLLQY
jgi:hypothetical protein